MTRIVYGKNRKTSNIQNNHQYDSFPWENKQENDINISINSREALKFYIYL